jgi:hypothetical protein
MTDTNSQTASQRQTEVQDSLLDSLLSETKLGPTDGEAYELVRRGTR